MTQDKPLPMTQATFPIRGFNLCESLLRHSEEQLRRFIRRMKGLRMNTIIIHYDYGWRRYKDIILEETARAGVDITLMTFGPRTFFSYSDWKPEWFAKKEDGSLFTDILECNTQPCRFQPEALEAFAYGAKEWLRDIPPQIKHVHMRAADGLDYCRCERCRNLPDHEKWQPFVEIFVGTVLENCPELEFETDIYVKRYNIPQDPSAHRKMHRIMYDTFYRHDHVPIGMESWNKELMEHAATESNPDADSPNEYHLNRMKEWCRCKAGKVYIHENAMAQGLHGVFQHNTGIMLKDLELYVKLGVWGVCYEAYEPGYANFEKHFEILAKTMVDMETAKDYRETPLEKELAANRKMQIFCDDMDFPLEKFLKDPLEILHVEHYRRCLVEPSPKAYRDYVNFAFEHEDRLDPLFIGINIAQWGICKGKLDFSNASKQALYMLNHRKLWDFMEEIPPEKNPIEECKELIFDLAEHVKAK